MRACQISLCYFLTFLDDTSERSIIQSELITQQEYNLKDDVINRPLSPSAVDAKDKD